MKNQRAEPRSLCADLVKVEWKDESGGARELSALLEDISPRGACLQVETPIPRDCEISVSHGADWSMLCRTVYCVYREIGYFVGIEFDPNVRWSENTYRPQHLLDLSALAQMPAMID